MIVTGPYPQASSMPFSSQLLLPTTWQPPVRLVSVCWADPNIWSLSFLKKSLSFFVNLYFLNQKVYHIVWHSWRHTTWTGFWEWKKKSIWNRRKHTGLSPEQDGPVKTGGQTWAWDESSKGEFGRWRKNRDALGQNHLFLNFGGNLRTSKKAII